MDKKTIAALRADRDAAASCGDHGEALALNDRIKDMKGGETINELRETLDLADDHTAMLMEQISRFEAALVKSVEVDLAQRVEIESLKIALLERRAQDSIKRHAFVELYRLCKTLGSFKNGVEHNGIDEGEVYASGIFDRVEAALSTPYQ